MKYYPVQRNWRKVRPHVYDSEVQKVLVRDFNRYTYGRWGTRFLLGMTPHQHESCDWGCDRGRPGHAAGLVQVHHGEVFREGFDTGFRVFQNCCEI